MQIPQSLTDLGEMVQCLNRAAAVAPGKFEVEIQVELKDRESPAAVAELLKSEWGTEKVVVTSLEVSTLRRFAELMPEIPAGHLNRDPNHDMVAVALQQGHRWICPRVDVVTPEWVVRAHRADLLVYVYHVNDRDIAGRIASWEVDAIGTDFPEIATHLTCRQDARPHQG